MALSEVTRPILSDPALLSDTQKIFLGELGTKKRRLPGSPSMRTLVLVTAAAMGWYGLHTLSHEPVCTSGTPVKVTNPTSFALRGTFTSHGCDVSGGTKVVLLARDSTGEQYAAPREDVQPITQ